MFDSIIFLGQTVADTSIISLDQIAVLLIVIIFLFGVVLVWIKVMSISQMRKTGELIDDLELILKKEIKDSFEKSQNEILKKIELNSRR